MSLQALIFDVDGTLAETERDGHRVAFNATFRAAGLDWDWTPELYGELLAVTGGKERIRHYCQRVHPEMLERSDFDDLVRTLHRDKTARYVELVGRGGLPLRPDGDAWFEVIGAGDVVPAKKPSPDIYLWVLERLGLAASDCLAIEDSRNGLRSALAAGVPTVVAEAQYTQGEDFSGALAVLPSLAGVSVNLLRRVHAQCRS